MIVTSRCGQPTLWDSMLQHQNVVLDPLSVDDAMSVFWRYRNRCEAKVQPMKRSLMLCCSSSNRTRRSTVLFVSCAVMVGIVALPDFRWHSSMPVRIFADLCVRSRNIWSSIVNRMWNPSWQNSAGLILHYISRSTPACHCICELQFAVGWYRTVGSIGLDWIGFTIAIRLEFAIDFHLYLDWLPLGLAIA